MLTHGGEDEEGHQTLQLRWKRIEFEDGVRPHQLVDSRDVRSALEHPANRSTGEFPETHLQSRRQVGLEVRGIALLRENGVRRSAKIMHDRECVRIRVLVVNPLQRLAENPRQGAGHRHGGLEADKEVLDVFIASDTLRMPKWIQAKRRHVLDTGRVDLELFCQCAGAGVAAGRAKRCRPGEVGPNDVGTTRRRMAAVRLIDVLCSAVHGMSEHFRIHAFQIVEGGRARIVGQPLWPSHDSLGQRLCV